MTSVVVAATGCVALSIFMARVAPCLLAIVLGYIMLPLDSFIAGGLVNGDSGHVVWLQGRSYHPYGTGSLKPAETRIRTATTNKC